MRELRIPESGPKRRLLDAAEQLFAERGFEAVSVRDITGRAKANVAAVNYHFGSREDLVRLVIFRYATPISEERLARLEAVEKKWSGKTPPLEEVIEAYLRPVSGIAKKTDLPEEVYHMLVGRIFALQGGVFPRETELLTQNAAKRFIRVLSKALPTVSNEELIWRTHFVTGGMIHLLIHQDEPQKLGGPAAGSPTMEAILGRFMRFATAGLREGVAQELTAKKGPQATFDF
jgi:AcrR family transcriptional regulator